MDPPNFLHDGDLLLVFRGKDAVLEIGANHRLMSRDDFDVELVQIVKLAPLGGRRSRHSGDVRVESNEILQRNGAEHRALSLEPHAFFGFNRSVQSRGPAAVLGDASLKFVN